VLPENHAMRDLALNTGFVVDKDASDGDSLRLVRPLRAGKQRSARP